MSIRINQVDQKVTISFDFGQKLNFLPILQSNLDFKVSNERSELHEPVIKKYLTMGHK